jgi:flagellar motor switch protein FliN
MGKTQDPKIENYESDLDPFAGSTEGAEGGVGDPFDFSENPSPGSSPKSGAVPPTAKAAPRRSPPSSPAATGVEGRAVGITADVPVQVVAVLGKKATTVKEILTLKKGQIIELNRFPNEAVDLVANGKLMAKGELVEIDGKLGVRIIKIFE